MTSYKKNAFQIIPYKAQEYIRNGTPKPISEMTIEEIPPVAISWGRSDVFKTGAWRNITPQYVRRLPPCRSGCPVGNDIEGWLRAVGEGRWDHAISLLIAEQPLPSVCGRVCYHPCETACNRTEFDDSVNIRAVERYLGDQAAKLGKMPEQRNRKGGGRILVIGSGPAGLSAAWMLARLGHTVEVREQAAEPGGLLRYGIPSYRLPHNPLRNDLYRLERLGVKFQCGITHHPEDGITVLQKGFDAVFLSPGATGHRSSGIGGETEGIVVGAIEFLAAIASGMSPRIGRNVVVIGGGNSAVDAARTAIRSGSDVTILYRRTRAEMPAYHEEIEAALEEGILIRFLASPEFIRRKNNRGHYLRCIRNVLGSPDDSGRRKPEPVPGSEYELLVDQVIDAVGEFTDSSGLTADSDEASLLNPMDIWGRTGIDGIWVGGDFTGGERTVAHAIGSGKRAAMAIDRDLVGNNDSLDRYLLGQNGSVTATGYIHNESPAGYDRVNPVEFNDLNPNYFSPVKRFQQDELKPLERIGDFAEVVNGFAMDTVRLEAGRCFHCGDCDSCGNCHVFCPDGAVRRDPVDRSLSFDLDYCKGCGICDAECPRAAIEMVK